MDVIIEAAPTQCNPLPAFGAAVWGLIELVPQLLSQQLIVFLIAVAACLQQTHIDPITTACERLKRRHVRSMAQR
jgi:hypothetical protein